MKHVTKIRQNIPVLDPCITCERKIFNRRNIYCTAINFILTAFFLSVVVLNDSVLEAIVQNH